METHKVKLVKSQNTSEQFFVLLDKVVGKGGFGTVYQAYNCADKSQKLVAKVMKIQNESRRNIIEKELKILSELPLHQNIIKILPSKIYSQNNYYMFMQYCEEGTLLDLQMKKKKEHFSEEEIYSMFYQCMNGYKVLFDRKILHQDIKPQNVLIKNGAYKLADFGLSIFYQGYNYTMTREGTLRYIAPQKLTVKDYIGNPKSDVYSFGIMFFELIVGLHPYVKPGQNMGVKQFLKQLKQSKLRLPNNLNNRLSLKFNEFFDSIILKMIKKTQKNRISFEQIWQYVQNNDVFMNARLKQREITKKHLISQYDFVVSEVTSVLSVPLSQQHRNTLQLLKQQEHKQQQELNKMIEMGKEVAQYFIKRRIIIYLLDRLIRKLIVEQLKNSKKKQLFDRCILYLMLLTKSLLNDLVHQIKTPTHFNTEQFESFKKTNSLSTSIISLLRKDHEYVEDSLCDLLSEETHVSKKQTKQIFQLYKDNFRSELIKNLSKYLHKLLTHLSTIIDTSVKSHLITVINITSAINILDDISKATQSAQQIETYQKRILMSPTQQLIHIIEKKCSDLKIACGFDLSGLPEEDEGVIFE